MSTLPKRFLTVEEYFELDGKSESRYEYFAGQMYAMGGARESHNSIVWNVTGEIRQHIRKSTCRGFSTDMRVQVSDTGLYTYPDIVVICGEKQYADDRRQTLINPDLIIEVLSPSTEGYDRGEKFRFYRTIESLREYVLIASENVLVERFTPQGDGNWLLVWADKLESSIRLETINLDLRLADIYENVEFGESGPQMRRLHPE